MKAFTAAVLVGLLTHSASARSTHAAPATGVIPSSYTEAPVADDAPQVSIGAGGFRVTSADGETSIKIGGRIQADATWHSPDTGADGTEFTDGTEIRRGRFELQGRLPGNFSWAAEMDFANNNTSMKDFWFAHTAENGRKMTFGHQKQPFSLGVEMSSNDIPFVERGIDNYLIIPFIDRAIGVRVEDNTDKTFWAAGLFAGDAGTNDMEDEGYGVVGRFVATPVKEDEKVLHLAARAAYRTPDGMSTIRIRDETTNMSDYAVVDTGMIMNVDNVFLYGGEVAYAAGPASVTAEVNQLLVGRAGEDFSLSSWHVEGTYSLTGETRAKAYRLGSGEFKRLQRAPGSDGPAWELAARFANIDLNDGSLSGGRQDAATIGVNCYVTSYLRLMFNWTHILDTEGGSVATAQADGTDIFTVRGQLTF